MKQAYITDRKTEKPVSWPLLILCFIAGILLATLIFRFSGQGIHRALSGFFH